MRIFKSAPIMAGHIEARCLVILSEAKNLVI